MSQPSPVESIISLILNEPDVEVTSKDVANNRVNVVIKADYRIRRGGRRIRGRIRASRELSLSGLATDSAAVALALGTPFRVGARYCVSHYIACLRRKLIEQKIETQLLR